MSAEQESQENREVDPEDNLYQRLEEVFAPDESYTHAQAEQELPAYVSDELLGRNVGRHYPQLHRHLLHCRQCAELHVAMLADFVDEPEPMAVPRPNLSFLPPAPSRLAELLKDVQVATRRAAEQIVAIEWPDLRGELEITTRIFFKQIDKLGNNFILQPDAARALGFGAGEVLPSQRVLAAVYRANQTLRENATALSPVDEASLREIVQAAAQDAAQEMGLSYDDQQRFVDAYVAWLLEQFEV